MSEDVGRLRCRLGCSLARLERDGEGLAARIEPLLPVEGHTRKVVEVIPLDEPDAWLVLRCKHADFWPIRGSDVAARVENGEKPLRIVVDSVSGVLE